MLVLTTRESIEGITDGKMTLGADASAAAGPVGRSAKASTDLNFDAEVYSYAKSQGLFLGVSLEGNAILISKKANKNFYEGDSSATAILASKAAPPAPAPDLGRGSDQADNHRLGEASPATTRPRRPSLPRPRPRQRRIRCRIPEPGKEPGTK